MRTLNRVLVNLIILPLANSNDQHNEFVVVNRVDQSVALLAQLDLVETFQFAVQRVTWNVPLLQSF